MLKKIPFIFLLMFSVFYCAWNLNLTSQELDSAVKPGIAWHADNCACWNYLEHRQGIDKTSWAELSYEEQEELLEEAKQICKEANSYVEHLRAEKINSSLFLNIKSDELKDIEACYEEEGKVIAEKRQMINAIHERYKNNALTEDDIKWLKENNILQAGQYESAYLMDRFDKVTAGKKEEFEKKEREKLEKFNAGTGRELSKVSKKPGDSAVLDNLYDGTVSGKGPLDFSDKKLGETKGTVIKGKSPDEIKSGLLEDAKAPPVIKETETEKPGFFSKLWSGIKTVGNAVVNTVKAAVGTVALTAYHFVKDSVGGFVTNIAQGNVLDAVLSPFKATANAAWNLTTGSALTVMAAADPFYQAFGGDQPPMKVEFNSGHMVARGGLAGAINNIGPVSALAMTTSQLAVTVDENEFSGLSPKMQNCILHHEFVHTNQYKNSFVADFYYNYWIQYNVNGYHNIDYEIEAYKAQEECMAR